MLTLLYLECYDTDESGKIVYDGVTSTTESGFTCQSWVDQTVHTHDRTPQKYPDVCLSVHQSMCISFHEPSENSLMIFPANGFYLFGRLTKIDLFCLTYIMELFNANLTLPITILLQIEYNELF